MYKRAIGFIITLVLLHSVSALSTTLEERYAQGETMLVEITGSIIEPLDSSDVEFLRGHVQVGSFEYDLKRLGDRYFLYAITPFIPNNYTLVIHNVATFVNGQNQVVDIMQNFTVTNETALYTLKPGFIITNSSFDLSIILNTDTDEEITLSGGTNRSLLLRPGANNVRVTLDSFSPGLNLISVGMYSFPLYNLRTSNTSPNLQPSIIEILPLRIEERFIRNSDPKIITFIIRNRAERELTNFEFVYDDDRYKLTPSSLRRLKANETASFNMTVLGNQSNTSDVFRITVDDETFDVPIDVSFTNEVSPIISRPSSNATGYYCNELNGKICLASQQCSGESVSTLDGLCCRGTCIDSSKESSLAWIGYLIGGIVLVIGAIIAVRYFKARKSQSENVLGKQIKKLERPF